MRNPTEKSMGFFVDFIYLNGIIYLKGGAFYGKKI